MYIKQLVYTILGKRCEQEKRVGLEPVMLRKSKMKRNMLTHLPSELARPTNLTSLISIVISNCIADSTSIDIIVILWTIPMFAMYIYQTCHNFGMVIRIFDLKFGKNPYQSVSLIRSSS